MGCLQSACANAVIAISAIKLGVHARFCKLGPVHFLEIAPNQTRARSDLVLEPRRKR